VDAEGEVGDVDACVALAGEVEVEGLELGEFLEEDQQGLQVVARHTLVTVLDRPLREADPPRRLQIQHTGIPIPRPLIPLHLSAILLKPNRPILRKRTQQG
jgi:hypothetical protein